MRSFKERFVLIGLLGLLALSSGCALFSNSHEKAKREILRKNQEKQEAQSMGNRELAKPNYTDLAKEIIRNRHYEVALVQLKRALDEDQESPEVFHLMGVCHRELEDYPKAMESFDRAIRLDEGFSFAYDGLGTTYALMDRNDEARRMFAKAVSLNPARADFHNNLGFLELRTGNYHRAEKHFRESLALNPDFHRARNNLAVCLGLSGKDKEAMEILAGLYPRPVALRNMGIIYQMRGDEEKASAMFREADAARSDPENPKSRKTGNGDSPGTLLKGPTK